MDNEPVLTYHQSIFDLLEIKPVISPAAQAIIRERELICGMTFPASVTEWFSIEGAEDLFCENTNSDELASLEDFGVPAEVAQGLLHVATENQGVVHWFARLDGSDDPPVVHDNDEIVYDDNGQRDLSQVHWELDSATFTNFIFGAIASHRFAHGYRLRADDQAPSAAVLEQLSRTFQQGPYTDLPDLRIHRFFTKHANLFIRGNSKEDIAASKAEWILEASTPEDLYALTQAVWTFGSLAQTLNPKGWSATKQGETGVLERLRSKYD